MTWRDQLKADPLPWLLESESPGPRYLALRDIARGPAASLRAARTAAHRRGPIADVLQQMDRQGFWERPGPGYNPKYRSADWSLILLAQLGASIKEDKRITTACDYLFEHAWHPDGQFSTTPAPGGTVDCLQGNLCWALLELGCEDARLDMAFDWMARTVTGEGMAELGDRHSPRRYYAYKRAPDFVCGVNNGLPCGWGAVKVMLAFSRLPEARRTPLIQRAIHRGVDFLLSIDPATAAYPTRDGTKPSRDWWKFGFPVFYITDLLQLVEALVNLGLGRQKTLARALAIIRDKQDAQGRWSLEYDYPHKTWVDFGPKRQPNKWVTLRALRVLKMAAA